jgi:lactoylglutathione lyase
MKMTTVRLFVDDPSGCADWYKKHFDLEERANAGVYVELDTGECKLGFFQRDAMNQVLQGGLRAAGDSHLINIEVENLDEAVEVLRAAGVEIEIEPHDQPDWFMRVAHVRDPEGNLVELYHSTYVPE